MKVISKKSSKKLLKGAVYTAESFNNTSTGQRWTINRIRIKGFGTYMCRDFTDENGNTLPQINYVNSEVVSKTVERFSPKDLKRGDIVVCNIDKYKYLLKGGKYRISEIIDSNNWSALIRLEGYNRQIRFNSWSFRVLNIQEVRDIALSSIFDTPEKFSVEFVRKFEKENNKVKILLDTIAKSIIDPYRHNLDIVDWGIAKTKNQDLKREDFNEILNMSLNDVLKLFENNS